MKFIKQRFRKILFSILFILLSILIVHGEAHAKSIEIQKEGEEEWKSCEVATSLISVNEKDILLEELPVFSLNGIYVVDAEAFFKNTLGCSYTYDTSENTVVISKGDTDIEFTLKKKTAYVNGKAKTLSVAPKRITYKNTKKSYIVVPFKFTATKLGYHYSYSRLAGKISMHTLEYIKKKGIDSYPADGGYTNVIDKLSASYDAAKGRDKIIIRGIHAATMKKAKTTITTTACTISVDIPKTSIGTVEIDEDITESGLISHIITRQDDNTAHIEILYASNSTVYSSISDEKIYIYLETASVSAKIQLPDGVGESSIKDKDQYNKNKFVITVPGNHLDFYKAHPVQGLGKNVKSITYQLTDTGNTRIIFKTSKLQAYKIYPNGDYLSLEVDDPVNLFDKIVVLDAGHGDHDAGASSNGTNEKDINYKVIYQYAKEYFNSETSDIKAYWTRTDDTFVTLTDRAKFADKVGADLFISLHMNSAASSAAKGTEVYYSKLNNKAAKSGLTSKRMATKMKNNLVKTLGTSDRGVKSANFVVIKSNTVPAILIELGFISNPSDYKNLTSTSFQKKSAKCIYDTVCSIFKSYPTGR